MSIRPYVICHNHLVCPLSISPAHGIVTLQTWTFGRWTKQRCCFFPFQVIREATFSRRWGDLRVLWLNGLQGSTKTAAPHIGRHCTTYITALLTQTSVECNLKVARDLLARIAPIRCHPLTVMLGRHGPAGSVRAHAWRDPVVRRQDRSSRQCVFVSDGAPTHFHLCQSLCRARAVLEEEVTPHFHL